MDLISIFLPYVATNPQRLNRHIEQHPALAIAKKYAALNDELSQARLATLGACQVTAKGDLKIESRPGMAEIQTRIASLEERVAKLLEISKEYGKVLESTGCTNPLASEQAPQRMLEHLQRQTEIAPACWQQFNLLHGHNQTALPGDLVVDKDYTAYESEKRSQRDTAQRQIEPLVTGIHKLQALAEEASAL